jgi:hypothetical protein
MMVANHITFDIGCPPARGTQQTDQNALMKWERAVHHLGSLARACAETLNQPMFSLRVTQLWALGDILGPQQDVDAVTVALAIDRPAEEVAWLAEPSGTQHWANAVRLNKNPFIVFWRSDQAAIWNHEIVRPALVWNSVEGEQPDVLAAIRNGEAERVRSLGPTEDELAARLADELTVSRNSLQAATDAYETRRWSPGKLEPTADALWRASLGYLDVLRAIER